MTSVLPQANRRKQEFGSHDIPPHRDQTMFSEGLQDVEPHPSPTLLSVVRGPAPDHSPLVAGLNSEKAFVSEHEYSTLLSTLCVRWHFSLSWKGEQEFMLWPAFPPRHSAHSRFLLLWVTCYIQSPTNSSTSVPRTRLSPPKPPPCPSLSSSVSWCLPGPGLQARNLGEARLSDTFLNQPFTSLVDILPHIALKSTAFCPPSLAVTSSI